jgi:hypothetical protein
MSLLSVAYFVSKKQANKNFKILNVLGNTVLANLWRNKIGITTNSLSKVIKVILILNNILLKGYTKSDIKILLKKEIGVLTRD